MALGLFPSSLRSRVLSIVFVAGFPLFCFLFFVHWRWQQAEIAQAHQDARRLADFAALEEQHLIEQARQLLINLAQFPQVRHGDATACSQIFANLLPQYPAYANFGAIRANGEIFCSGVPLPKAEMTQTSPLKICFDKATEMKEFTIGDYAIGRLTGRPVLLMAYPASVDSDSIQTVVFAALDLAWLNQFAASAGLPHGATLTVVDRNGVVLAHHPESEAWVGKSATELPLVHSVLLRGETEASSANGETPIFALSSLPGAAHAKDTHVVVSIPKTSVLAGVEDAFIYSVFTFIGVVLLAGGLAWGGSTRLLTAHQPLAGNDTESRRW
ncbi:MAG: cache domain-containing protein [Candidatus Binatia bacterium]